MEITLDMETFGPLETKPCKSSPYICLFDFVEVLWPSRHNGVMSSLPNNIFTGQAKLFATSIVHIFSPETDNCPS